ncbi:MAG TPA: DUF4268 domain-containing protein [bacterium]|nr:DUF4268 domain-containing protein [bacterium]
MIGKIERVPLREIWRREAKDFTSWLRNNIDVLNEVVDITLTSLETEKSAGAFSVDLVAEDEEKNTVIIENQLGKSDHDHLGKLVTYLTALEASYGIWIVADPRPEHITAVTWLNESTSASFYLIKIEAVRIGDSEPAPLLTIIVGPSEESREIGEIKKEKAERYKIRKRFWTGLLEKAKAKTQLHANIAPSEYSWVGTGAGKTGLGFNYTIKKNEGNVELYIDRGRDAEEENKKIFDELYRNKEKIEEDFGPPLDWERLDDRRASRIKKGVKTGGYANEDKWPEIQETLIDYMVRFEKALRPYINRLSI